MSYQVLFSGELADGANEAAVRFNLARKLGLDERKVSALFSGRTVVLRSQLKRDEAVALQAELSDMGAVVRIKDLSPDSRATYKIDSKAYKIDTKGPDQTLKDITAAHVECARCGHLQLEAEHCARCGVDMNAAAQQKRKEDLLIEKKIRELRDQRGGHPPTSRASATNPAGSLERPGAQRVLVTEKRRPAPPAVEKPKKGWLSKLKGR